MAYLWGWSPKWFQWNFNKFLWNFIEFYRDLWSMLEPQKHSPKTLWSKPSFLVRGILIPLLWTPQRRHTTLTQYASSSTGEFQANFSLLGLSYHHGWAQKFVRIQSEKEETKRSPWQLHALQHKLKCGTCVTCRKQTYYLSLHLSSIHLACQLLNSCCRRPAPVGLAMRRRSDDEQKRASCFVQDGQTRY